MTPLDKGSGEAEAEKVPLLDEDNAAEEARKRRLVFLLFPLLNFFSGASFALQPPFFPKEAALKGVAPSVYGFAIGIFHVVVLLCAPVFGKYINKTGARCMIVTGSFVTALAVIGLGFLEFVPGPTPFTVGAFALRILQGVGNAAFATACYAMAAVQCSDNIAGITSLLQIAFALGRIAGPIVGGLLEQADGYYLPFLVIGGLLFVSSAVTTVYLPPIAAKVNVSYRVLGLLAVPSVAVATYQTVCFTTCYSLMVTTLEPYLRQFELKPSAVGFIFVIDGVVGSIANVAWGYVGRQKTLSLKFLTGSTAVGMAIAFLLLGPAPFLSIQPNLGLTIFSLVFLGLNIGGQIILPYVDNAQEVVRVGYPKSIETFAVVSGLWNASINLGSSLGSSLGGVLLEAIGFRWAMVVLSALQLFGATLNYTYYGFTKCKSG